MRRLHSANSSKKCAGMVRHKCHYCGAPAVKLCDHVIGFASDDEHIHKKSEMITCSRPLCDECATKEGIIFFSDGPDTIDLCRDHVGEGSMHDRIGPAPLKDLLALKRRLQFREV